MTSKEIDNDHTDNVIRIHHIYEYTAVVSRENILLLYD